MLNRDVKINNTIIGESTKITLTISMLFWIISGLISIIITLATIGYFDIKTDVKNQKDIFDDEKMKYKDEIREMIKEELRHERDKREKIIEDIGEIKGDIKVILEKTRDLKVTNNSNQSFYNMEVPDNFVPPPPQN